MDKMKENPIKFRWVMTIAFVTWGFMAICFGTGVIVWKEFTFVHTFIPAVVMLVALAPCSMRSVASAKFRMLLVAVWGGTMIPGTYIVTRQLTGFGNHCDLAFMVGGGIVFSLISAGWAITIWGRRKWVSSIGASVM